MKEKTTVAYRKNARTPFTDKKQRPRKPPKLTFTLDLGGGVKKRVTPSFACTRGGHVWMHLLNAATGEVVVAIGLSARKSAQLGRFLEKASFQAIGVS